MQIYLVGGAVRDALLGRPVKERDWVVVGATPDALLAEGYKPVGKDFPVFLHPHSKEEYALARTERKTAAGYHGFEVHASPEVTLEEDLARRDLTINAMARDQDDRLIDPFNGYQDLQEGWLRHVSPAFAEDPVRILRLARFLARYQQLGFRVAPATLTLMREMVSAGEVDALVAERVWAETYKALGEPYPDAFFATLRECGALARILPELDQLFGVPQYNTRGDQDSGSQAVDALRQAVAMATSRTVRFAALVHGIGRAKTPAQHWPQHPGYEQRGAEDVKALAARLRLPRPFRDLAVLTAAYHRRCHQALDADPAELLTLLEALDAQRRPERFAEVLLAAEAIARTMDDAATPYRQAAYLRQVLATITAVPVRPLVEQGLKGKELAAALREQKCQAIIGLAK